MARYQGSDVAFDVQNDWDDKTVVAFSAPPKPGAIAPNVVLTRDKLKPDEKLEQYCDRTIVDMVKNLAAFQLLGKDARDVDGTPAFEIRFTWSGSAGKTVLQRMLIAQTSPRGVLGVNFTCDSAEQKRLEPIADRVFASLKLTPLHP